MCYHLDEDPLVLFILSISFQTKQKIKQKINKNWLNKK